MAAEASTAGHAQAKLVGPMESSASQMSRIYLLVVVAVLVLLGAGGLLLGAFPPTPQVQPVEKVLPNDQFKSG